MGISTRWSTRTSIKYDTTMATYEFAWFRWERRLELARLSRLEIHIVDHLNDMNQKTIHSAGIQKKKKIWRFGTKFWSIMLLVFDMFTFVNPRKGGKKQSQRPNQNLEEERYRKAIEGSRRKSVTKKKVEKKKWKS